MHFSLVQHHARLLKVWGSGPSSLPQMRRRHLKCGDPQRTQPSRARDILWGASPWSIYDSLKHSTSRERLSISWRPMDSKGWITMKSGNWPKHARSPILQFHTGGLVFPLQSNSLVSAYHSSSYFETFIELIGLFSWNRLLHWQLSAETSIWLLLNRGTWKW